MSDEPEYDYSGDQEAFKIGDNLMKALISAADRQEALEAEIEVIEEELAQKKQQLKEVSERDIPNMVDGLQGSLVLTDGRAVEIKEKMRASIAGAKALPACKWLDEHGHGSLIKRQFVIEFNKDDEAWAKKFERDLRQRKKPLNVKRKNNVHPGTLESWVNEKLKEGVDIPKDIFGLYRHRAAKISRA